MLLFPFCAADQLLFFWFYTFFTSTLLLKYFTELIQLQSNYIHVLLKSRPVSFQMAFADPRSRGLVICWLYNLILSGRPLFSSCFMIPYTSQALMNSILLEQKKHINSSEENFPCYYFSCYYILKEKYHLGPSSKVIYNVLVTEPNLSRHARSTAKPVCWHRAVVKESSIICRAPSQEG